MEKFAQEFKKSIASSTRAMASPSVTDDTMTLTAAVKAEAQRIGFDLVGIAPAVSPTGFQNLQEWLNRGYAGEMQYLARRESAYQHPRHVLPSVKSVILLAVNYHTQPQREAPNAECEVRSVECKTAEKNSDLHVSALVSRYAWGTGDYHDVLRGKLRQLADFLHQQRPACSTRGVVDTAPLLERDFARLAGLGWFGKNTMLIHKRLGSWLFLAGLLTDVELEYDQPHETAHCGTCTRCLDACPTDAFPEPYVLDARKCISYLTIELHDAPIPEDLRDGMGRWLFGCDICQDVCPWNHKAPISPEPAFQPLSDLSPANAIELLQLDENQFHDRFKNSPLLRPKRSGLLRNAAIILGNSGDPRAVPVLIDALDDAEPLIRGAAAWALGCLGGEQAVTALRRQSDVEENDTARTATHNALQKLAP